MPNNLVSLIRQLQPVKALMTSYTFELCFFEGLILQTLHKGGCQGITVLVDSEMGLEASLDVEYGGVAGVEYALHGVRSLGKGVFHPKIAYLTCAETKPDVLVVASGNLTAPGQGLQLECLDAIQAEVEPKVFEELARFCQGLVNRLDPRHPAIPSLSETAKQSMKQYHHWRPTAESRPRRAWLVDTLSQPVDQQLVAICQESDLPIGGILTVLSPFHTTDGTPIINLAHQLGASGIQLGLDPKNPVARCNVSEWPVNISCGYVLPEGDDIARSLHAKVFCYDTPAGSLVMTGSVNATQTSLSSTDNVELSLVRLHDKPVFQWKPVEQNTVVYTPNHYQFGEKTGFPLTVVALLQEGELTGYVSDKLEENTLRLVLRANGQELFVFPEVQLDEEGHFCLDWPDLDLIQSIQVHVICGTQAGRCWLMMQEELSNVAIHRAMRERMRVILGGNPDDMEAELFALLMALMTHQPQHMPHRSPPRADAELSTCKTFSPTQPNANITRIPGGLTLRDLKDGFRPRHTQGYRGLREQMRDALWAALEGRSTTFGPTIDGEPDLDEGEDGDEDRLDRPNRGGDTNWKSNGENEEKFSRKKPSICTQLANILARAEEHRDSLAARDLLLLFPRYVLRNVFKVDPTQWTIELFIPCEQWIRGLSPDRLPLATWPAVQGAAVQVVVLLAWAWEAMGKPLPLTEWHDTLIQVLGSPVTKERMNIVLDESPLLHNAWLDLAPEQVERHLLLLAEAGGTDQQLLNVVRQAIALQPMVTKVPSPILCDVYRSVLQWQKTIKPTRPVLGVFTRSSQTTNCPLCHSKVASTLLPELKKKMAMRNPSCTHLLVYLRDGSLVCQLPEGLYREGQPHV